MCGARAARRAVTAAARGAAALVSPAHLQQAVHHRLRGLGPPRHNTLRGHAESAFGEIAGSSAPFTPAVVLPSPRLHLGAGGPLTSSRADLHVWHVEMEMLLSVSARVGHQPGTGTCPAAASGRIGDDPRSTCSACRRLCYAAAAARLGWWVLVCASASDPEDQCAALQLSQLGMCAESEGCVSGTMLAQVLQHRGDKGWAVEGWGWGSATPGSSRQLQAGAAPPPDPEPHAWHRQATPAQH